jgi:hypothetical protein
MAGPRATATLEAGTGSAETLVNAEKATVATKVKSLREGIVQTRVKVSWVENVGVVG